MALMDVYAIVYTPWYACKMARDKTRIHPHQILGTRELRAQLPQILRGFRDAGADAELLVGGANRHPEVVLLSYKSYLGLMDELDNLSIQALYAERVEGQETLAGRTLEDAATELGFDPDELFAKPAAAQD